MILLTPKYLTTLHVGNDDVSIRFYVAQKLSVRTECVGTKTSDASLCVPLLLNYLNTRRICENQFNCLTNPLRDGAELWPGFNGIKNVRNC
jgi:hypothetical protein